MKSIIIIFCLASATGLSVLSCGDAENHKRHFDAHKKQVVVDTDMGLDDMRAIMAILADTGVAVKGIIVNTGSADQGVGADNLIGMLESHHIETVPVLKGIDKSGHKIPAWRETANNLSGSKFPPPRELGSTPLPDNWLVNQSYTDILALGPLSNLAAHVDRLSGSCRIWIPASVTNQEVHEWNFTFDPEAAEKMFSKAGTVFLVDIPEIPQAQVYALLSGLGSASPTVRWISDVVTSADTFSYKQIFDEFVVAALLYPQFLANDGQRYRCRIGSDGAGRLEPADDGNVRLVSFKDHTQVEILLAALWRKGPVSDHGGVHGSEIPPGQYLRAFHGHLGPYVVLGYRMGRFALERLGSDGHFDLAADVHTTLHPPYSCFIDGIQLGTGCTLGKRNIQIREEEGPARVIFTSKSGKQITIRLHPDIPGQVAQLVNTLGVEAAGREMMSRSPEKLFIPGE